jgi:hypothetical protein
MTVHQDKNQFYEKIVHNLVEDYPIKDKRNEHDNVIKMVMDHSMTILLLYQKKFFLKIEMIY